MDGRGRGFQSYWDVDAIHSTACRRFAGIRAGYRICGSMSKEEGKESGGAAGSRPVPLRSWSLEIEISSRSCRLNLVVTLTVCNYCGNRC